MSVTMHNFLEDNYLALITPPAGSAAVVTPASGSFIDVSPYIRCGFLIALGAVDEAGVFAVKQDTSATQTAGVKALTNATHTIAATDDNKFVMIEFTPNQLDINNSFKYVCLDISVLADVDDIFAVFFWGMPLKKPATMSTLEANVVVV